MWSSDIELVLSKLALNCNTLSYQYKKNFRYYKHKNKYFAVPNLIITSIAAVLSTQLQPYTDQTTITTIITGMLVVSSIIQGIRMFLQIDGNMNSSNESTHIFQTIATDIQVMLLLARENRPVAGIDFYKEIIDRYHRAMGDSKLLRSKFKDALFEIDCSKEDELSLDSLLSPIERNVSRTSTI